MSLNPHQPPQPHPEEGEPRTQYWRFAVWIAIGALIASAIVCVIWVLIGPGSDIIGKAFLTILLLAAFSGSALLDASLAERRPQWYALLSMIGWVVILLAGAVLIWSPPRYFDSYEWDEPGVRIFQFLLIVLIVRLAILHNWLYLRSYLRRVTPFLTAIVWITVALVGVLTILLVIALTIVGFAPGEFYWRIVVAITILATVGTAIVPLVRALTTPRQRPAHPQAFSGQVAPGQLAPGQAYAPTAYAPTQQAYTGYAQVAPAAPAWPTYVDGVTPLPALPDGSPDFNAYYTGQPTYPGYQTAATPEQQQVDPRTWAPPSAQTPPQAPPAGQAPPTGQAPPAPPYPG